MTDWNDPEWFARTFQAWDETFDTRHPQPDYVSVFAAGEPPQPIPGMSIVGSRKGVDAVAPRADQFTWSGVNEMGNVRLCGIVPRQPLVCGSPARMVELLEFQWDG